MILKPDELVVVLNERIALFDATQTMPMKNLLDGVLYILLQTARHIWEHLKVIKQISREIQQKINTALESEFSMMTSGLDWRMAEEKAEISFIALSENI